MALIFSASWGVCTSLQPSATASLRPAPETGPDASPQMELRRCDNCTEAERQEWWRMAKAIKGPLK